MCNHKNLFINSKVNQTWFTVQQIQGKLSLGVIATVPYRPTSPSLLACSVIPCCNGSQPLSNHPLRQFGPHPPTTTSPQPSATIPSKEETEEETEPLEAPPFLAATVLMGTRLRSLEEEEEIGGGGGHGDGVPNSDEGRGGDGRELGRL
ncbi:hypothetical protein TIFTF001_037776 [Ficus carica]|uniref:Uncharacterized protein n=1 Tax=Ficus carica TaxID=3494 RepID=A0AA88JD24_FICCA|nr:hypothetical protein TIFTF001_037768 [Ficus carica]GMN68722.1 hypothetical protein TIFTF001_037776 [Ficus carica]